MYIYKKKCNENKAVEKHYSKIHYRPHGAPLNEEFDCSYPIWLFYEKYT